MRTLAALAPFQLFAPNWICPAVAGWSGLVRQVHLAKRVGTVLAVAWAAAALMPTETLCAGRDYARSMVMTRQGIVATNQTLASQAGAQVLARGGSAVDAAIAANAVMGVVEPMSYGIGGDLFVIYWDARTGALTGLNASGWAPKGLSIDFLKQKEITAMPQDGIHTVTVPGCVDGWRKLHERFGRLPWAD